MLRSAASLLFFGGATLFFYQGAYAEHGDAHQCSAVLEQYFDSLVSDLESRDQIPQTEVPRLEWDCCGRWGPPASRYPGVDAPGDYDPITWRRDRLVEVAKKYIGLRYLRSHIPERGGLDCSNFTSWIYNYGLGVQFSSNVEVQSRQAGRQLEPGEALVPGDLIFLRHRIFPNRVGHVLLYIGNDMVMHSGMGSGIRIDPYKPSHRRRFVWARRVVE